VTVGHGQDFNGYQHDTAPAYNQALTDILALLDDNPMQDKDKTK